MGFKPYLVVLKKQENLKVPSAVNLIPIGTVKLVFSNFDGLWIMRVVVSSSTAMV